MISPQSITNVQQTIRKDGTSTGSAKRSQIEVFEEMGYQHIKHVNTCSKCKLAGHNKRSCKSV